MSEYKKVREYWETCKANYAHLKENRDLETAVKLRNLYKKVFMDHIDFKDKTMIDYGTGSGHVGKYLFDHYGLGKYIGIDIAHRSLKTANYYLKGYNAKFKLAPQNFGDFKADIFISLACIQHFPSEKYLIEFLNNLNKSNIPILVLQIRHYKNTIFNNAYDRKDSLRGLACRTNYEYVNRVLTKYNLKRKSKKGPSGYQYLIYEVKNV
jgi:trans-aconitate methyltransferase